MTTDKMIRTMWPESTFVSAATIMSAAQDAIDNGDTVFDGHPLSLRDAMAICEDAGYYTFSTDQHRNA